MLPHMLPANELIRAAFDQTHEHFQVTSTLNPLTLHLIACIKNRTINVCAMLM